MARTLIISLFIYISIRFADSHDMMVHLEPAAAEKRSSIREHLSPTSKQTPLLNTSGIAFAKVNPTVLIQLQSAAFPAEPAGPRSL